ncbi:hypothetical protein [Marinobacter mangrovi]|uniref:hypothetical protein n=1 Tax=Marinobacter mangrovi TaxID=2803918 RepID=UPI00193241D1|nr:hypothetical protein [Marinobacter mangrovi]
MSELYGTIVFEAKKPAIADCLTEFSEETPAETVQALLNAAGVSVSDEAIPRLLELNDGVLFSEDIDFDGDYVVLAPFGEEWIEVLQLLSQSTSLALAFWGKLHHEHGVDYYVAVSDSRKMITAIDEEDGELDDDEIKEIEKKWRAAIPDNVRRYLPDDFE